MTSSSRDPRPGALARRLLAAIGLLVLVVVPASRGSASPTAPGQEDRRGTIGIRLLESPTERADDPRARQYVIDHLTPGATITRRIEVSNTTDRTQEVALYAAGAAVEDGRFTFADGRDGNELSGWTTIEPAKVEVPAGGAERAEITIAVPSDASDGERYAVVWAEPPAAGDGTVRTVNRVGIRIYLSVGDGAEPASDFAIRSLTARRDADGRPAVSAEVENTGGRALDLNGSLSLTEGPGGISAGPFDAQLGTTLGIGQTEQVLVPLDPELPLGPWTARLVLRSGTTERDATASLTFPKEAERSAPAVATESDGDDDGVPVVLVAAGALVLVVVAGGVWFVLRRRRTSSQL